MYVICRKVWVVIHELWCWQPSVQQTYIWRRHWQHFVSLVRQGPLLIECVSMRIHKAALSGLLLFKQYLKPLSLSCLYFEITLQIMCHYFYVFMKYVIKFELTVQFSINIMPMEAIPHSQWQQYQNGSCEHFQDRSSTIPLHFEY